MRIKASSDSGAATSMRSGEYAFLTCMFVGPMASFALVAHYFSGSATVLPTMLAAAVLFWLPINPVGIGSVALSLRAEAGRKFDMIVWGVTLAGVAVAVLTHYSVVMVGFKGLASLF